MKLERLRWLVLGLLFFSTVINYVDRQALSVLLPTLRNELGFSTADYGSITTIFLLAYTVGQVGAGMWIDKIGTRRGFSIFIVIWSVAAGLHAFARGALSLGFYRGLLGLGESGNWPAGGKAVAQWFPPHRRAFAMAVFDGGSALGAIVAPPLVAFLALRYGWRSAFLSTSLLGFLWLVAWLWIYESPEKHRWLSSEDRARANPAEASAGSTGLTGFGTAMRRILGVRQLWGLMLTRMVATPVWWFYVFWLPDYLSQGRGFTLKEIGFYAWIPYLTVDLGKMLGGAVSDRLLAAGRSPTLARKSVMAAGALLMGAGILVVGASSAAAAVAWVCVATFGFGMWSANILALHADIFPSETIGSAVGLTGMAASLGGAIFTYIVGRLVTSAGYAPVFWVVGTLAFAAFVALVFAVGRVERIRLG
ncbi:MAG: MFS transporter [Lacunisphaera sp.]